MYIKRIRLKNFESHEDTVIDDLSTGLNAIVGASNAGKSAIVRALKLICYNDFDPQSIRKGSEDCEVEVTTDNGTVKVIRGKQNSWTVTDRTGKKNVFSRIGKQLLPEVSEILGFGLVKLGDMEMQANIMDQLEAHFMLAEFSGQEATGSLRAQVVDEISGLSGIETLIRDVSLDNSRTTRAINQLEERNKEISTQLHDVNALQREEAIVAQAEKLIQQHDDDRQYAGVLNGVLDEHTSATSSLGTIDAELVLLPDEGRALVCLASAEKFMADLKSMQDMKTESDTLAGQLSSVNDQLTAMPDPGIIRSLTTRAEEKLVRAAAMFLVHDGWKTEKDTIFVLRRKEASLPDPAPATSKLGEAETALNVLSEVTEFKKTCDSVAGSARSTESLYRQACEDEKKAVAEYNQMLAGFKTCPITMKPISGECLKDSRIAVQGDGQ